MANMAPNSQESAEWPGERRQPRGCRIARNMTSGKSISGQLHKSEVCDREGTEWSSGRRTVASQYEAERARCHPACLFCWIKAVSAHSDHCIAM